MQAPYNEITIQSLLRKLRIFNRDIGQYELFAITENFDYVVKLSNGKILITIEELQEDEKNILSTEQMAAIAKRFVPSEQTVTPLPQVAEEEIEQGPAQNTTLFWTILVAGLVILVVLGSLAYVDSVNEKAVEVAVKPVETYKEKVMTIEEIESSKPARFLMSSFDYKKNIWGTKIKLDCKIKNTATIVSYQNAVLRVSYFDDTKKLIGSSDHTLFENFPSQSEKEIELKIENIKGTDSVSAKIIGAKAN